MITNVYVDGFNLFYGSLKDSPHKWLDLEKLFDGLLPKNQVQRIRYFTARVKSNAHNSDSPKRQDVYLRALGTLPRVSVHFGHYLVTTTRMPLANPVAGGPSTVEVVKSEEKGSDVNLATYLLADAFRNDADAFVVVSNDSDLKEPMRVVRHELNKVVGILNPHKVQSKALLACKPSFTKDIRTSALARSHFPDPLIAQYGNLTKPSDWL